MAEEPSESPKKKSELWEWVKALLIAGILAILIRSFVFAPFLVEGSSMMPNLENKERLIVNRFIYYIHTPQPGEILVFHATKDKDYIKRVIATEGQTVEVRNDTLYINGKAKEEPYLAQFKQEAKAGGVPLTEDFGPVTVPKGQIFVMGDNRRNSTDSRFIGTVNISEVVGRADIIMWPLQKIKVLP